MVEIDEVIALEMFKLRVLGQSERKVALTYNVTTLAVRRAVARVCPIVDTASRVFAHGLALQRYEDLLEAHFASAKAGDQEATTLCLKIIDHTALDCWV